MRFVAGLQLFASLTRIAGMVFNAYVSNSDGVSIDACVRRSISVSVNDGARTVCWCKHHCLYEHCCVCEQVRQHNEAIWPQVTVATAAQQELDRVGRFIEHIRSAPASSCFWLAIIMFADDVS